MGATQAILDTESHSSLISLKNWILTSPVCSKHAILLLASHNYYEVVCQRFYIASNDIGKFLDPDLILIDTQKWYVFFIFFNVIKQV